MPDVYDGPKLDPLQAAYLILVKWNLMQKESDHSEEYLDDWFEDVRFGLAQIAVGTGVIDPRTGSGKLPEMHKHDDMGFEDAQEFVKNLIDVISKPAIEEVGIAKAASESANAIMDSVMTDDNGKLTTAKVLFDPSAKERFKGAKTLKDAIDHFEGKS